MSVTTSKQPRKQRKAQFNAPAHQARKMMASHLAEDLILKYNTRATTVVLGDTVKVIRGDHKGHTGKVADVDVSRRHIVIEGMTNVKADGTKVPRPVHPSNLVITKLNMSDARRRDKLTTTLTGDAKKKALAEMEKSASEDRAAAEAAKKEVEELRKAAHAAEEARLAEDDEHDHDHDHEVPKPESGDEDIPDDAEDAKVHRGGDER